MDPTPVAMAEPLPTVPRVGTKCHRSSQEIYCFRKPFGIVSQEFRSPGASIVTGKRFFRHGELPLVILTLLTRRPMNAYRLLSEIEAVFGDVYEPSTGTVYPAVSALVEEGLLICAGAGAGRTYQVTEQGRRALAARRDDVARLELRTGARLAPDDSLDAVLHGFLNRVRQLAPHLTRPELEATLDRATEELLQLSRKGEARHT